MLVDLALVVVVALASAQAQDQNWVGRKFTHHSQTPVLTGTDVNYFANGLGNEANFRDHLREILIPRVPGTEGNRIVREHIVGAMRNLSWHVEISSSVQKTPIGDLPFHNVIATLDPNAPRRLVLACHYDSKRTPQGFLGATDSAVPCSQMINLAFTMRRDLNDHKNKKSDLTLQLVFFDGEEAIQEWRGNDNTYGARDLATKLKNTQFSHDGYDGNHLDRIDLFVLLDLIGAKDPTFVALQRPTKSWFDRLVNIESRLSSGGSLTRSSRRRPMFTDTRQQTMYNSGIADDHIHFEQRGVPILHLITFPFPKVWHKLSDNASAVDYNSISDLNKIFRVFVAEYLQLQA